MDKTRTIKIKINSENRSQNISALTLASKLANYVIPAMEAVKVFLSLRTA